MSWVDIFYLTLVICAISGFAASLAYFAHADLKFRRARERPEQEAPKPAAKQPKPKIVAVERIPEHA